MFYLYSDTGQYIGTSDTEQPNSTRICPDQLTTEWYWNGEAWNHNLQPVPRIYGPVDFKLRFTIQERLAINAARATDPIVDDFYSMLDDVRLTSVNCNLLSVQEAIQYLETTGLIGIGRAAQILS